MDHRPILADREEEGDTTAAGPLSVHPGGLVSPQGPGLVSGPLAPVEQRQLSLNQGAVIPVGATEEAEKI